MTVVPTLNDQLARTIHAFEKAYGRSPRFAAAAPGRVNLIGEHTDYNDGFVLPMAIERQTVIVADRRDDGTARVASTGVPGEAVFDVAADLTRGEPIWANYVKGAIVGCLSRGLEPGGFDAVLDSNVPTGGGLSSSAALEVATATLMEALSDQSLDPVDKALLCQQAEHDFAGMPCGIMDQFISAMGQEGAALLIDCRSHQTRAVPLDDADLAVLIINSNVKHELTGSEYPERRAQCEAAAKAIGVKALRDASLEQLEAARAQMDEVVYRRARHVIGENQRTLDAADAMTQRNWPQVGDLMLASHASLRDDFEVSCPELDTLVELAKPWIDAGSVFGSRMTGGGFGGCTVSLVKADQIETVGDDIARRYQNATGIEPSLFATRPAAGARVIEL